MSRISELKAAADQARDRARYAQRELERFTVGADLTDPVQARTRYKLESDANRAADDLQWAVRALESELSRDRDGVFA